MCSIGRTYVLTSIPYTITHDTLYNRYPQDQSIQQAAVHRQGRQTAEEARSRVYRYIILRFPLKGSEDTG